MQELSQNSIDKANDIVKKFCRDNNFLKHRTKFQLKLLNAFLNRHKYQAIIMMHNPNALNNKISNNIYTKTYSNNTKFSNDLICTYIKEIM